MLLLHRGKNGLTNEGLFLTLYGWRQNLVFLLYFQFFHASQYVVLNVSYKCIQAGGSSIDRFEAVGDGFEFLGDQVHVCGEVLE
jgi:hypothetical protein